jgi:hypothetical protein
MQEATAAKPAKKPNTIKKGDVVTGPGKTDKAVVTRVMRGKGRAVAIHQPQLPAAPRTMLQVLMEAVRDPKCDAQKMMAIIDVQERLEKREAMKEFNTAFIALQAELPSIRRDGKIEIRAKDGKGDRTGAVQQATPYATFNAIMKTIKPLLTQYGFALSFSTSQTPVGLLVVHGLLEGHGHARTTEFPLPAEASGSKNNVQGWGSSLSYGKRYCTIALLNIVSDAGEDRDTDGHEGNFKPAKGGGFAEVAEDTAKVTAEQRDKIADLMIDANITEANFCLKYGIAQIGFLPASLFDAAVKAIADHKAAREKAAKEQPRG